MDRFMYQVHVPVSQSIRCSQSDELVTSPFIFNTLVGLLRQWPNTKHPNGHTIIPGTIAPFTLLYHARKDLKIPPPSFEWLAFTPEMSFALMVTTDGPSYLSTFRTTRPSKIVYFDGMSSALGTSSIGWLDSQEVLLSGKGRNGTGEEVIWWDDYARAGRLCDWAKRKEIDGFVRMNTGFELLWCNFTSTILQTVSHLNVTPPGTPTYPSLSPYSSLIPTSIPPNFPPPPWSNPVSPLAKAAADEWIRSASHRANVPQPHITLDYSKFVSFYHPKFSSLASARVGKRMWNHRIWPDISESDAIEAGRELDEAMGRKVDGSGVNWELIAHDIVEYWSSRIMQLQMLLSEVTHKQTINPTNALHNITVMTYSPLNPYMDMSDFSSNSSKWDPFFSLSVSPTLLGGSQSTAFDRCAYSATSFASNLKPLLTPQEGLLKSSMEYVLRRICSDIGTIFTESYQLFTTDHHHLNLKTKLGEWGALVNALVGWLDWSEWSRCEEPCGWDSVCTMTMWPVNIPHSPWHGIPGDEQQWQPRCQRLYSGSKQHVD